MADLLGMEELFKLLGIKEGAVFRLDHYFMMSLEIYLLKLTSGVAL